MEKSPSVFYIFCGDILAFKKIVKAFVRMSIFDHPRFPRLFPQVRGKLVENLTHAPKSLASTANNLFASTVSSPPPSSVPAPPPPSPSACSIPPLLHPSSSSSRSAPNQTTPSLWLLARCWARYFASVMNPVGSLSGGYFSA